MGVRDAKDILVYLQKSGPTNTFKLAKDLGKDRLVVLNTLKDLEENKAIELKFGIAKFLEFPEGKERTAKKKTVRKKRLVKEKTTKKEKKVIYKPKKFPKEAKVKKKPNILNNLTQNKKFSEKLQELEENIKKQSDVKAKLKEQAEHIENIEKTVDEIQQKAELPPKIIRRTVIKNLPTKIIRRTIIKEVPVKPKKFKLFKLSLGLEKIKQFKLPKFAKPKMKKKPESKKPKIKLDFSKFKKIFQKQKKK